MKEIEESIHLIRKYLPDSFDEFNNLDIIRDGIYKRTEFAIENIIDICAIINSDLELGIPANEEDIIHNLLKKEILSDENAVLVRRMKGFRNFLVHRYGSLDDQVAFENIKSGLNDLSVLIDSLWDAVSKIHNN